MNARDLAEYFRDDVDPVFRGEKAYFREVSVDGDIADSVDRVKFALKRYSRLYYFIIALVSPVLDYVGRVRNTLAGMTGLLVNVGSGNRRIRDDVVNVDMFDYENVDVVTDIHDLPFRSGAVGGIVNVAVLEHVRRPEAVLAEMHRVLADGGQILSIVPFVQPFHASPHDYQRYSLPGLRQLHREFEEIDAGVFDGPVAASLWIVQESLAALLSFGSTKLRDILAIVFMLVTWPLKILDWPLRRLRVAENAASTFYFHGRKRPA